LSPLFFIARERSDNLSDQLKLQIQATIDQAKSQKEIQAKITAIQKGIKLKVGLEVDDKTTKQGLKSYEQMQTAFGKTAINQRKELANVEFKQAQAVNKYLDQEYAKRLRNIEAEKKASDLWNSVGKNNKIKLASDFQMFLNENTKIPQNTKSVNDLKTAINNINDQASLKKVTLEVKAFESQMMAMGKMGLTRFDEIKNVFSKFGSWYLLGGALVSGVNAVKLMFKNVVELDKAMINLRMVTGSTYNETVKLVEGYGALAQRIGATTKDTLVSANEFLRQGKTAEETSKLIETSMIFSKIAALDSAKSTQYLTSAMKGYGISTKDTLGIVDKLSTVDIESATNAGGLAEAMSRTANSAQIAGVSMDKLISYLAVVGEVTQKEMSSVGESFKTIFSRMGNVKLGIYMDDDGEDLSDVEKILGSLDIKLRDSNEQFRNFGDVLDEVGGKWGSYNKVQQSAIANAFAGKQVLCLNI
jgi:TP901 family phage tail tape measure protein